MLEVKVIGAGLAGCEAAWQLAERGIHVTLTEMKPQKMTPAHHCADFAELVCSNSLRGDRLENAVGLLKEELRRCGSLILACADATRVEAGRLPGGGPGRLFPDGYGENPESPQYHGDFRRNHRSPRGAGDRGYRAADFRCFERGHRALLRGDRVSALFLTQRHRWFRRSPST